MCQGIRFGGLIGFGLLAAAFAAGQTDPDKAGRTGLPDDWSHHHIVFSQPDSTERLDQVHADLRYWQQVERSVSRARGETVVRRPRRAATRVDWGEALATPATAGLNFSNVATSPAKYSFNGTNPDCANDYVVFALPTGASTAANLYAFTNLYVNNSGTGACPGASPVALFTYNASRGGGSLNSSPTLSLDGTQIGFVEDSTSAQFHVLKWKAGDVSATFGTPWNSSLLPDCAANGAVAPCEYSVVYSAHTATLSAPYVDYTADTAYVTDDAGMVAAISPVFGGGTPKVVFTVTTSGNAAMTPPVYDSVSKNVFAADASGILYYVRTTAASSGACGSGNPPCVGTPTLTISNGTPISDAPIVDSSSGTVFVFTNSGLPATSGPGAHALTLHSSVVQTSTTLGTMQVAYVGPQGASPVYDGAFNNAYYNNPGSGVLYVCGTNSSNIPQLYGVTFTGTQMNQGPAAYGPLALGFSAAACSPLTEVFNQSTSRDLVFLGVNAGCYGDIKTACIAEFDVTNGFPSANTATVPEANGTTGIIIDNVSNGSSGNASQTNLYFVTLGEEPCTEYTGGIANLANCLVKLTQTGLQ